jgi:hypothetical protein
MFYNSINTAEQLQIEFKSHDREDQFSLKAYEYILDYNEQECEDVELDVPAICGIFSEEPAEEIRRNYSIDIEDEEDELIEVFNYLKKHTWAVKTTDDKILYLVF